MNARWFGTMALGAALLLGAGPARAYDGYSGDTGGPPPPDGAPVQPRAEVPVVRDGLEAIRDGWAGDTGSGPIGVEARQAAPRGGDARTVADARGPVMFTDRG